jgi:hypothetical protein
MLSAGKDSSFGLLDTGSDKTRWRPMNSAYTFLFVPKDSLCMMAGNSDCSRFISRIPAQWTG